MRKICVLALLLFASLLCAAPYGKALKRARNVDGGIDFRQAGIKVMDYRIRFKGAAFPAPCGAEGLKRLLEMVHCDSRLLGIDSWNRVNVIYAGPALGPLLKLRNAGEFPVIFTKPAPNSRVTVIFADGSVRMLPEKDLNSNVSVIRACRGRSTQKNSPVWAELEQAVSGL